MLHGAVLRERCARVHVRPAGGSRYGSAHLATGIQVVLEVVRVNGNAPVMCVVTMEKSPQNVNI